MKSYHQKFISNHPYESVPMAEISGFPVRPGIYDLNGATPLQNGVNFTIHTCGGTSCELLLFHRAQEEPFAVIPFPDAYKIGDVYSMIVYGLNIEEFEYAYRVDGPYRPEKGFSSTKTISFWILMQKLSQDSVRGEFAGITTIMHELSATVLTGAILHNQKKSSAT